VQVIIVASKEFDVLVIGEGLAGATASAAAVSEGASVALVSKGPGSFVLADGCVELEPDDNAQSPLLGREDERLAALRFFLATASSAGCEYWGGVGSAIYIPTVLGTLRRVALAPLYFGGRDIRTLKNAVVAGFEDSLDFNPKFIAERLALRARVSGERTNYTSRWLKLATRSIQPAHELEFATHFDRQPRFREAVLTALQEAAESADLLIVPAVLGLNTSTAELRDLCQQIGCPICEIATLPPSVLGMRLLRRFERYLSSLKVQLLTGFAVSELLFEDGQCRGAVLDTPGRPQTIKAQSVVVATGGFSQLLDRASSTQLSINDDLQACGSDGKLLAANLYVCGGALRTSNIYSENAVAILTGYRAGRLAATTGVHHAGR
jgi:glycerol-3-phosphate dehydrogenase subunit B